MANSTAPVCIVPRDLLLCSIVFKLCYAMIIGFLGNVHVLVIVHIFFSSKEKNATAYLIGNLAAADILVRLTYYPTWIIEFLRTISDTDSDQVLFCKLSRSIMYALIIASVATFLAVTVDRYLYFVKPIKYPMIVTCRRVFVAVRNLVNCLLLFRCSVPPPHEE